MKIIIFLILVFFAGSLQITKAQENSAEVKTEQVEVSSFKDPELRTYAQMLNGMKIYNEKHQLAPDSELYFIIIPKSKSISMEGLTLRLVSDDTSINIPIDSTGKFQLPVIEIKKEDEYDLILNKPKGQFYIRPYVKSVNLPDDVKRMGDLRLECQVRWAVDEQTSWFIFRTYVKLLASGNPCTSRTVEVWFIAPEGANSITLSTPKTKISYSVSSRRGYAIPLWNTEFNNDDLIKYERN